MSFIDFIHKLKLEHKATSSIKVYQVLPTFSLSDIGIYLRDRPFEPDIGIANLHPSKRAQRVAYRNEYFFDSYSCSPPQKVSKLIIKRSGHCFYSGYKYKV